MKKSLTAHMAIASFAAGTPALTQTVSDTGRMQDAQSRLSRELSIYRSETGYRGRYNRNDRAQRAQQRIDTELTSFRQELDRYQAMGRNNRGYAQNGNGYGNGPRPNADYDDNSSYDPSSDYRDGPNYQERALANEDGVYRGTDGRYYCKRNDGTTGLIIGAVGGGVLGNVIDGGHNRTVGTLLGGVLGAVAGRAVERSANDRNGEIRCR